MRMSIRWLAVGLIFVICATWLATEAVAADCDKLAIEIVKNGIVRTQKDLSIPFDPQLVGTSSKGWAVRLNNKNDQAPVVLTLVTTPVFSSDAGTTINSVFAIPDKKVTIPPKGSADLNVTFSPQSMKEYSATLEVYWEDGACTNYVALSGTGIAPSGWNEVIVGTSASGAAGTGAAGGGVLFGLRRTTRSYEIAGLYNASEPGSIKKTTVGGEVSLDTSGSSLLNPNSQARSFALRLLYKGPPYPYNDRKNERNLLRRLGRLFKVSRPDEKHWGKALYLRAGVGSYDWESETTTASGSELATDSDSSAGSLMYGSFGMQYASPREVAPDEEEAPTRYGVGFELGLAARQLTGDIAQVQHEDLRGDIVGTRRKFFWAPEATLFFDLGDVRPFVTWTHFTSGSELSGFSGGQITFGVQALTTLNKIFK